MNIKEREAKASQVLKNTIYVNVLLTVVKVFAGVVSQSTAMLSDAVHTLSDVLSTFVAMVGVKISSRPPDDSHHYGHGRAETVATKFLAMLVAFTGFGIGWTAVQNLLKGEFTEPGGTALWAAVLSIAIKEWMYRYSLKRGQELQSNAIIADAHHHRSDALSSITAFIGIGGGMLGFPILDPLAGLIVAVMIVKVGLELYWDSIQELVDRAPEKEIVQEMCRVTVNTDGVLNVHDIKARHHGPYIYVDLKVCVNRFIPVYEGHDIAHATVDHIKKHFPQVKDVLVHVNPCQRVQDASDLEPECHSCSHVPTGEMLMELKNDTEDQPIK